MSNDYLDNLNPQNLVNVVRQLAADVAALKGKTVSADSLDELSADLGTIQTGEFRAGNGVEPGSGFTGGRFGYPGFLYNGKFWFLAGVQNDQLMVGLDLATGAIFGAGGDLTIDELGLNLNGVRYGLRQAASDPNGENFRYGRLEMQYSDRGTIPSLCLSFTSELGSELLGTNCGFELGTFDQWSVDNNFTTKEIVASPVYGGNYAAHLITGSVLGIIETGNAAVSPQTSYEFRLAISLVAGSFKVVAAWSSGDIDVLSTVQPEGGYQQIDKILQTPAGATYVRILIYLYANSEIYADSTSVAALSIARKLFFDPDLKYQDNLGIRRIPANNYQFYAPRGFLKSLNAILVATSTGNVTAGGHHYKVTFVDATGETNVNDCDPTSDILNDATHKQNLLTIPVGPAGCTARKIYRSRGDGTQTNLYLATIADNITTTYTDNIADSSLSIPGPTLNTTSTLPLLPTKAMVRWKSDVKSKAPFDNIGSAIPPYGFIAYGMLSVSANLGDWYTFDVFLAPGSYKMLIHCETGPGYGIVHFYEDDVKSSFGTTDFYIGGGANAELVVDNCILVNSGLHNILMVVDDKNPSSSDYKIMIADIEFIRN